MRIYPAGMSPQAKGTPTPRQAERIRAAVEAKEAADAEVVNAVVSALKAGASTREVAAVSGIHESTVYRWGHEHGWPTEAQKAAKAEKSQAHLRRELGLEEAHQALEAMSRMTDPDRPDTK